MEFVWFLTKKTAIIKHDNLTLTFRKFRQKRACYNGAWIDVTVLPWVQYVCMNEWMSEWMNVFKVTISQLKRLQGHWTKYTSWQVSVVSENVISHVRSSNDALNRTVLRSSRKAFKDQTVLTLDDREFQAHATATGKARPPIVDRRVDGAGHITGVWFSLELLTSGVAG